MRHTIACFTAVVALFAAAASSYAAAATIGSIRVAPGGSRIEIQGDQPLTYLYRKMTAGPGILLDIAPGRTRGLVGQIPGAGHVTGIWVKELQVEGIPVTRLAIELARDAVVNVARDSTDPGRLLVTFPSLALPDAPVPGDPQLTELIEPQGKSAAQPARGTASIDPDKPALAAVLASPHAREVPEAIEKVPPVKRPQPEPVKPKAEAPVPSAVARPIVQSINVEQDRVEIVTGTAATTYDSFRLNGPERLVIDLPGATSSMAGREVRIGRFGVAKARVGVYPDKVRVVFDADSKEGIPLSIIQKAGRGIKVTFAASKSRR